MTHDDHTPTLDQNQTPDLTERQSLEHLLQCITNAAEELGNPQNTLARQTQTLDGMFTKIIETMLNKDNQEDPRLTDEMLPWFALALQAQKQCTQAIKAKSVTRYMDSLSALNTVPAFPAVPHPYPHPLKNDEQTDEF